MNLNLAQVLTDFMTMARENDLAMPTDLAILFKSLVSADGVMRQLDPEFDLFTAAGPTVQQNMKARFSLEGLKKKVANAGAGLFSTLSDLPALVHLMLVRLKQGKMTVEIEIKGMDQLIHGIEVAATRLAIALVVAAFTLTIAPRLLADRGRVRHRHRDPGAGGHRLDAAAAPPQAPELRASAGARSDRGMSLN